DALQRLDGIHVVTQTTKQKQRAVEATNLAVCRGVEPLEAELPDLVVEQPLDRVADRVLDLAGTEHSLGVVRTHEQESLCEAVRLRRASPTKPGLVSRWRPQLPECPRDGRLGLAYLSLRHHRPGQPEPSCPERWSSPSSEQASAEGCLAEEPGQR